MQEKNWEEPITTSNIINGKNEKGILNPIIKVSIIYDYLFQVPLN